jgi:uncharacterized membrane protein YdjX (TVP38/TMEM64 family)
MTTLRRHAPTITWASFGIIMLALLSLTTSLPIDRVGSPLITWVDGLGLWGPIVFSALYVAATILFVPVVVLTLVAGGIFGVWLGALTVSFASTLSAAVTFLTARYLAREQVSRWVQRKPQRRALEQAIGQGGWKIIILLRFSTVLPFSLQNCLFGLTPIGFWPYLIASWLAMLPGTFMYVYLGHATRAVANDTRERTTAEWVGFGVGLIATMAAGLYVAAVATKKLREQTTSRSEAVNQRQGDKTTRRGRAP